MLFAPLILLYFLVAVGVLIFVMVWTIRRAREGGRAAILTTIGIWAAAGFLTTLAGAAWVMTNWRSPASASPQDLTGLWSSDSPDGRATIELRPDGSAVIEGVPSEAAWTSYWMDDVPDLPAVLFGEGAWRGEPFESIELTCADGQTLRLLWQTVESPPGVTYLQFITGDPDDPEYFGEFSRSTTRTLRTRNRPQDGPAETVAIPEWNRPLPSWEPIAAGDTLNESDQEEQFRAALTELARAVLDPGDQRVYDIIIDNSNRFHEFFDLKHGGAAYGLWANVTDLLDYPYGPASEQLCQEIGRKAADEWMALDPTSQDALIPAFGVGIRPTRGISPPESSAWHGPIAGPPGDREQSLTCTGDARVRLPI